MNSSNPKTPRAKTLSFHPVSPVSTRAASTTAWIQMRFKTTNTCSGPRDYLRSCEMISYMANLSTIIQLI
jgi:hypothetical protein